MLKKKHIIFKTVDLDDNNFKHYENQYLKIFVLKSLEREVLSIYFRQMMAINKFKFAKFYLLPLTKIVEKIYKKKIEFNLVNIKYLYLNSYIFSETIVKKLKNRKNPLLRVLNASLLMFKLPYVDKLDVFNDIYNKERKTQNLKLNRLFNAISRSDKKHNDIFDSMLNTVNKLNFVPKYNLDRKTNVKDIMMSESKIRSNTNINFNENLHAKFITKSILNTIKNKSTNGIRIEAAGRLSKRNTAQRSVFKLKYKGNIKNIDSSFKGLPSVLLRGHAKSNVQYTRLIAKRRIGSFGIKG